MGWGPGGAVRTEARDWVLREKKVKSESINHSVVSDSLRLHGLQSARLLFPWNSAGKNTGVGSHSLLQGIFLTQGWNLGLLHCRQILYHLSHQGSPKGIILSSKQLMMKTVRISFFFFSVFLKEFLSALSLGCCEWTFCSCRERGPLLLRNMGSRLEGLSSCGSRAVEHWLRSCGSPALAAPWHVGSSWTRNLCSPCFGWWIVNH